MLIITFTHQKGGVGKTTLSLNLYSFLKKEEINVAIYDGDPQGSIRHTKAGFEEENEEWKSLELIPYLDNIQDLQKLNYDVLIIDTPPYLSQELPEIVKMSDLVIFPCKPSPLDVFAIRESLKLLDDVNVKKSIVINMVGSSTSFHDEIRNILKDFEIDIFKTEIRERVEYKRNLLFSPSIFTSTDKKAIQECENFGNEVLTLLEN